MRESAAMTPQELSRYMGECRTLVLDELRELVARAGSPSGGLYELMLEYPLREGKGLRPALCVATCRGLGGTLEGVLRSAAVLELYHNAFLIHDDVEDGSEKRRSEHTLHRLHGVPIAVNVGDGMLALALLPLLDNVELLGLGRSLRILRAVARMARESAEGQMLELDWIRRSDWAPTDRSYVRMVYKKSAFYSFVTPMTVGAIAAGADRRQIAALRGFAIPLGIAFQIQDDVLNLVGEEARYGKEIGGDLWEGKHTLALIQAMRRATPAERRRAVRILRKRRPSPEEGAVGAAGVRRVLDSLVQKGELSGAGRRRVLEALAESRSTSVKSEADVRFLARLIDRYGGVEYARERARRWSIRSARALAHLSQSWPDSIHRAFLAGLVQFVVDRNR